MIYKKPIQGKLGVYSDVSKNMVFGICCDTKKECMAELRNRIGTNSFKYRWSIKTWTEHFINKDTESKNQYIQRRKQEKDVIKAKREKTKQKLKHIKENICLLPEEKQELIKNKYNLKNYRDIDSVYDCIKHYTKNLTNAS